MGELLALEGGSSAAARVTRLPPAAAHPPIIEVSASSGPAWTEERVAALKSLWERGRSAAQIAAELGGGVTRNGVLGKIHRLGLSGRKPLRKAAPAVPARPKVVRAAPAAQVAPRAALRPPPVVQESIVAAPVLQPAPTGGVALDELKSHHCRWIVDGVGAGARYCACRRVPDAKFWYCAAHQAAAIDAGSGRRRRA